MRKLFNFIVGLTLVILLALTIWISAKKSDPVSLDSFLSERLPTILDQLTKQEQFDLGPLFSEARPAELNNVDLLLPHYQVYDYDELHRLYEFSQNCSLARQMTPSRAFEKSWTWVGFVCGQNTLPKDFFKKAPYIFPSGQSFARLAQDQKMDLHPFLTAAEINFYLSASEFLHLQGIDLNLQQIKGLLAGENFVVGTDFILVQKNQADQTQKRIYMKVLSSDWNHAFEREEFFFDTGHSSLCLTTTTHGCWIFNKASFKSGWRSFRWVIYSLDALFTFLLLGLFFMDRRRRSRAKDQQKFILQMLTHELRTPVTTLSLLIENERPNFDQLSSAGQIQYLKMNREIARLKNSMQMSYAYLQTDSLSDHKVKMNLARTNLTEWLHQFYLNQEFGPIELNSPAEDLLVDTEIFWLELCVNNLLRNAFEHGALPVRLTLRGTYDEVILSIADAGEILKDDLHLLSQPFQKGAASSGLGLGLTLVRQIMAEMQGRLEFQRGPTSFSLHFRRIK